MGVLTSRRAETGLAYFTLAFVAVFAPLETIYSWPYGLASPYYVVDVIAIGLMFAGALRSVRARPTTAPALMTVGWAWAGANFWRATLARQAELRNGGKLDYGATELTLAIATTAVAMACVAIGTWMIVRRRDA